jgi:cytochrome b-561
MPTEGLYLNFVAFLLIFYGVMVVYILIKPEYKRPPKPKDVVTHIANI